MFKVAVTVFSVVYCNRDIQVTVAMKLWSCHSPVGDSHGVFSKTNVSKPKLPMGGPHDSAFEDGGFVYLIGCIKVSLYWASLLHDQSYC